MRILHVIDSLHPRRGGPPIVAASLAAAQAALGHEVHLLSYAHADAPETHDKEPLAGEIPGFEAIHHVRLPRPGAAERLLAPRLRKAIQELSPPDVAHLHRVWEPMIPAAAGELRRAGVPYILSPHGMLHPWSLSQRALKKRLALALLYGRALAEAAALHALNAEEQRQLEALGLGPPVHVVANGVWLRWGDDVAPRLFRRLHPQLADHPFVLFMGRLHHKKGADILVEAFALAHQHLPDVRLVIAGDDSGAADEIDALIAAADLQQHVLRPGPIYDQQKQAALAEAACFCLPSRQEGFPLAVLEAMAAGLPVLISRECYLPEVQSEGAGLVLPLSATEFAHAMQQVLSDEAMRRQMGARGRAMVQSSYTWPKIAQQMLDVYASLAGP